MSFDRDRLAEAILSHGPVARVVVAEVRGSAPREVGTAMLLWSGGSAGTIGGGALELAAMERARAMLTSGGDRVDRTPLGPALGQCCGGAVTLLTEIWDAARLDTLTGPVVARPLPGGPPEPPLTVARILRTVRGTGAAVTPGIRDGWMIEPVREPRRDVWIYGAGHVGRAIVTVLAPLPDLRITWVDTGPERFPVDRPRSVVPFVAAQPADAVAHAPATAEHLVLTYSHAFDLEICHRILGRSFGRAGLIGSATKWARFRGRLAALGHGPDQIARIECPIGDPALGKAPQAIAIGVAAEILARSASRAARRRA